MRLSVYTSNKLTPELRAIKRKLGLTLIKFEDANIELDPFIRLHPFETAQLIIDSVVKHYKVFFLMFVLNEDKCFIRGFLFFLGRIEIAGS